MRDCQKCLATNSYKKVDRNGISLYICQYCNSVLNENIVINDTAIKDTYVEDIPSYETIVEPQSEPTPPKKTNQPINLILALLAIIGPILFTYFLLNR